MGKFPFISSRDWSPSDRLELVSKHDGDDDSSHRNHRSNGAHSKTSHPFDELSLSVIHLAIEFVDILFELSLSVIHLAIEFVDILFELNLVLSILLSSLWISSLSSVRTS